MEMLTKDISNSTRPEFSPRQIFTLPSPAFLPAEAFLPPKIGEGNK